jgi:glycosyltransferase involved in cell wall biosynthesis
MHESRGNGAAGRGDHTFDLLYVTARYPPFVGGTEIHTAEMAEEFVRRGHTVTVLTTDVSTRATWEERVRGVKVVRVPARPRGSDYYFAPGIFRYVFGGKWDLVHCQGYHTFVAPLAMAAAIWRGQPFVVGFHSGGHSSHLRGAMRPVQQLALRPLLARAERLIGVSDFETDYFARRLRLPRERFVTIPNGANLPGVARRERAPAGDDDKVIICSVGRLERYKGHHLLIACLPLLRKEIPNAVVQIVGTGPYADKLKRLARKQGVSDAVEFFSVPPSERERLVAILCRADLVVLLSEYESQGLSAYEALGLGRPVVVADRAALGQLAALGAVRAVPPGSSRADLARILASALRSSERPEAIPMLTWDEVADRLTEVYVDVLEGVT